MNLKSSLFIGTFVVFFTTQAMALVQAQISQQGDTVHLEFDGQAQWDYEVKRVEKKGKPFVEITLPAINEENLATLKKFSHPLIQSIQADPNGPDGKVILSFQLANAGIEPFDYLTEKPSRLIVDFFKNQKEQTQDKKIPSKKLDLPVKTKTSVQELPSKGSRAPASTDVLVINDQGQQVSLNDALASSKARTGSIFDGGDPNY